MRLKVHLVAQLGLSGPSCDLRPMLLDVRSVGQTSAWAGSYHVLEMGRHFDDYVVTGYTATFPRVLGLPPTHPYEQLAGKIRATGVVANVGECVAALFARRYLGASIQEIMHIRARQPFRRRKAPDYAMRVQTRLPGPLAPLLPNGFVATWPEYLPVESKASATRQGAETAHRNALAQLGDYWSLLAASQPAAVGYGMVVSLTYRPVREVRVQLFIPRNQAALCAELTSTDERVSYLTLRRHLYG